MALLCEYEYRQDWNKEFMPGWREIASIDESGPYEVDQTTIFVHKDGPTFALATASGCSCWDGDWQVQEYETLEDIERTLGVHGDDEGRRFNPSFDGARKLIAEARRSLEAST